MDTRWTWLRCQKGQDLTEYALLIALVIIFALGAIRLMGNTLTAVLHSVASTLTSVLSP